MIKFNLKLGAKHLNMEARLQKQMIQPLIKGMHCRKCTGVDTWLTFQERTYQGLFPQTKGTYLVLVFEPVCCAEFKERIERKIREIQS